MYLQSLYTPDCIASWGDAMYKQTQRWIEIIKDVKLNEARKYKNLWQLNLRGNFWGQILN